MALSTRSPFVPTRGRPAATSPAVTRGGGLGMLGAAAIAAQAENALAGALNRPV